MSVAEGDLEGAMLVNVVVLVCALSLSTQDTADSKVADRLWTLVTQTPERGTAVRSLVRHYSEGEGPIGLRRAMAERFGDPPRDVAGWMVSGLVYEEMGREGQALEALRRATELDPESAQAAYLLGTHWARVFRDDRAVVELERALRLTTAAERKNEILELLGHSYHRSGQDGRAGEIWSQLLEGTQDPDALESLAISLQSVGFFEQGNQAYEKLIALCKDDPSTRSRAELARIELLRDWWRPHEAIRECEALLERVDAESWVAAEALKRLERILVGEGGEAAVAKYYRLLLESEDVGVATPTRLARAQARMGDIDAALKTLEDALKTAPEDRDLVITGVRWRHTLGRYEQGLASVREWLAKHPQDVEFLEWEGELTWQMERDPAQACDSWQAMIAVRPKDSALAARAASLCKGKREARENSNRESWAAFEEAFLEEAIRRDPVNESHYLTLADFHLGMERQAEALGAYRRLIERTKENPESLRRLARLLADKGFGDDAIRLADSALALDPQSFESHLLSVNLRLREGSRDMARRVDDLIKVSSDDGELELALGAKVQAAMGDRTLQSEIDARDGRRDLSRDEAWFLAIAYQSLNRLEDAVAALAPHAADDSKSFLAYRATLLEESGDLEGAARVHARLRVVDPAQSLDYGLREVSLLLDAGRRSRADRVLTALAERHPAASPLWRLMGDRAYETGDTPKALEFLRRAVRLSPGDLESRGRLADLLYEESRYGDSFEHTWELMSRSTSLDRKLELLHVLVARCKERNAVAWLRDQVRRSGPLRPESRSSAHAITNLLIELGDPGRGWMVLKSWLEEDPEDVRALRRLIDSSWDGGQVEEAITLQERLIALNPSRGNRRALIDLVRHTGDPKRYRAAWKAYLKPMDADGLVRILDLEAERPDPSGPWEAACVCLQRYPSDWRLMLRAAILAERNDLADSAKELFEQASELLANASPTTISVEELCQWLVKGKQEIDYSSRWFLAFAGDEALQAWLTDTLGERKLGRLGGDERRSGATVTQWMMTLDMSPRTLSTRSQTILPSGPLAEFRYARSLVRSNELLVRSPGAEVVPDRPVLARVLAVVRHYQLLDEDDASRWLAEREVAKTATSCRELLWVAVGLERRELVARAAQAYSRLAPEDPRGHLARVSLSTGWDATRGSEQALDELYRWMLRTFPGDRETIRWDYVLHVIGQNEDERAQRFLESEKENARSLSDWMALALLASDEKAKREIAQEIFRLRNEINADRLAITQQLSLLGDAGLARKVFVEHLLSASQSKAEPIVLVQRHPTHWIRYAWDAVPPIGSREGAALSELAEREKETRTRGDLLAHIVEAKRTSEGLGQQRLSAAETLLRLWSGEREGGVSLANTSGDEFHELRAREHYREARYRDAFEVLGTKPLPLGPYAKKLWTRIVEEVVRQDPEALDSLLVAEAKRPGEATRLGVMISLLPVDGDACLPFAVNRMKRDGTFAAFVQAVRSKKISSEIHEERTAAFLEAFVEISLSDGPEPWSKAREWWKNHGSKDTEPRQRVGGDAFSYWLAMVALERESHRAMGREIAQALFARCAKTRDAEAASSLMTSWLGESGLDEASVLLSVLWSTADVTGADPGSRGHSWMQRLLRRSQSLPHLLPLYEGLLKHHLPDGAQRRALLLPLKRQIEWSQAPGIPPR